MMLLQHKAHLEIRGDDGAITRRSVGKGRIVIGRSKDVDVQIDHPSVSRMHAEIFVDPFDRWWIRDLGSQNGTLVNSQRIDEAVIQSGAVITIGPRQLTFQLDVGDSDPKNPAQMSTVTVADTPMEVIGDLDDAEPPRIMIEHLRLLTQFGEELLAIDDTGKRMDRLCTLLVADPFHGKSAMVLELGSTDTTEATVLAKATPDNRMSYVSRSSSLVGLCQKSTSRGDVYLFARIAGRGCFGT